MVHLTTNDKKRAKWPGRKSESRSQTQPWPIFFFWKFWFSVMLNSSRSSFLSAKMPSFATDWAVRSALPAARTLRCIKPRRMLCNTWNSKAIKFIGVSSPLLPAVWHSDVSPNNTSVSEGSIRKCICAFFSLFFSFQDKMERRFLEQINKYADDPLLWVNDKHTFSSTGTIEALKIRNKASTDTHIHTEWKRHTNIDAHTDTNTLESRQYWTQTRIKAARKTKQLQFSFFFFFLCNVMHLQRTTMPNFFWCGWILILSCCCKRQATSQVTRPLRNISTPHTFKLIRCLMSATPRLRC